MTLFITISTTKGIITKKTPHEKDYVMRFTRANEPVTKLVEIVKLVIP